ncbi:ferrous iron transport protein A [Sphingobium sufflavum]|uniref:FeoA family protein n=1 Tax=Sphingobium sufflavum TaxID=1129547 RepID=UPI001F324601|nr:FeoA family protein [Sphingobium sufflavum]MCE7795210.1 ferrous iron transport protein A [Sphingobium sufflavum]
MRLDKLPQGRPAYVDRIDWTRMSPSEGQRLREFGVCEGASIELLHRGGLFGGGAVAARVGRMTIAMRAGHASAIEVSTEAAASAVRGTSVQASSQAPSPDSALTA